MLDTIKRAIIERKTLTISYHPGTRIIEPHCLGWSADGNPLLRAYQTEGASASGEHEHWKLFRVDRVLSGSICDKSFDGPRPLYNPKDKAMKGGVIARL
jgi:predicted DNA-binding transcriptional regulator YafY